MFINIKQVIYKMKVYVLFRSEIQKYHSDDDK